MNYEVIGEPSYSLVKVNLEAGEEVFVEAGSMVAMEGDFEVETRSRGLFKALISEEGLFLNKFVAKESGSIWFAPSLPGNIRYIELKDNGVVVVSTAYLAHHGEIKQEVIWRGFRGIIGGGGLLWLRLKGQGGIWINGCGEIVEKEIKGDKKFTLDNLHLVCMDDTLDFNIRKFGGLKSFLLGGEGLVMDVKGTGRLYLQTRNPSIFFAKRK